MFLPDFLSSRFVYLETRRGSRLQVPVIVFMVAGWNVNCLDAPTMTFAFRRALVCFAAFVLISSPGRAHPGHDGHELTWDLSHLADFPLATLACFSLVGGAAWLGWVLLRRGATLRVQSLRESQPNRGK